MVKGLIVGLTSSSTESVMTATKKPNQAGLDRRAVLRGGLLALGSIGAGALRSLSADAPIEVPAYPTAPAAVGNGKMGPGINQPNINKGDDSNIPGAPKQPAP